MLFEEVYAFVDSFVKRMLFSSESFADGSTDPDDLVVITDPDPVVYVGVLADGDGEGPSH